MLDYRRTATCGQLTISDAGREVTLSGWVHRRRDHGGLIFVDLRDRYGLTQLVFDPELFPEAHRTAERLRSEWVVAARGQVRPRREGMTNPKLATGEIEIAVQELSILSQAKTPPFLIADTQDVNEELCLKYRYLQIRMGTIAANLELRHKIMMTTRRFLDSQQFLEITTPVLGKSTPEGARDYLVPSRIYPGHFYALPQSPQIFKQLLMVAGMDRYFQIAPCFRDEDLRADRQPEFTQIDIEMSFGHPEDLMQIIEGLITNIFASTRGIEVPTSFRKISHAECLERYGSDRPDLRFGMPLHTLDDLARRSSFEVFHNQLENGGIVKGLCIKGGSDLSRKNIDEYTTFVGQFGVTGLAWMKCQGGELTSSIAKFFPQDLQRDIINRLDVKEGDLIFIIADMPAKTNQALDHLRRRLARDRRLIAPDLYEFLWVVDFPLFSFDEAEQRLQSEHHPFTSPLAEDIALLDTEPLRVRSSGYDLVLNGYEIGGGSQRIHDSTMQAKIFSLLHLTPQQIESKFGFFVEALSYGTPPHLGIALGLDRLAMILADTDNIRDVIAFPKTQKASDLMLNCPSAIDPQQLKEVGLALPRTEFTWR